jgi:DNA-binding GntR family transcriptional regulator
MVYCDHVTFENRSDRIRHDGATLLWRQVADDLTKDIQAGALKPGWKLPTEIDLADIYGVSRNTIRRATIELAEQGLLDVVHGRGTFVTEQ